MGFAKVESQLLHVPMPMAASLYDVPRFDVIRTNQALGLCDIFQTSLLMDSVARLLKTAHTCAEP